MLEIKKRKEVLEPAIVLVEGGDFKEIDGIDGNIHSGIIYEIKDFLFFFDNDHLYCFNVKKKKITTYKN